jgi:hypothetical protein
MFYKVRVKKMPKAQSGLEVKMRAGLGFNANQLSWPVMAGEFSEPEIQERQTLGPVDVDEANLEAELGETAVTDLSGDGIPEHYKIGGKRHYDGGTPLNLPDNSFIFSRDRSMKIKDKKVLEQFGITNVPMGGITPADIAKKFNVNKYKKILLDKNSDDLARKTAEMMIANYNLKLGMLAFVQESMKGFPGGIPYISAPYLESIGLNPDEILNKQPQAQQEQPDADMGEARYGGDYYFAEGGDKGKEVEVSVVWVPQYKKYMFEWYDENGKRNLQSANPFYAQNGDGRTAEEVYNQDIKPKASTSTAPKTSVRNATQAARQGLPPISNKTLIKPPLAQGDATSDFDPRLGEYNDAYYELVNKLNADPKVKKAIYDNYRARIESNKTLTRQQKDDLLAKDEDTVVKNLLNYQKQNYIIRAYDRANDGIVLKDKTWDRTANGLQNARYKQVTKELGFKDDEIFNDEQIRMAQAGFAGLVDVASSDEHKDYFKDYQATTGGPDQLTVYDKDNPLLSDIDTIYGNNTASAIFMARTPEKTEEVKKTEETNDQEKLKPKELKEEFKYDMNTPFWLQDIIKTAGAFGDYSRIKKYLPWQATPSVDYMEPTFMSPERELASNAEQLAIGSQGLAQFTGPQAYNARFSQLAGQAAANAADVLGRYNNINVGIANEAEKFNVETFNKYAEAKSANATNLFDKVTIANQQYDNSKAQARQQLRQGYIDAVTNRAQTDVLNTMYPQFAVNPLTGGTAFFRNPKEIKPTKPSDKINELSEWMGRMPGYYGNDPKKWADLFWQSQGYSTSGGKLSKGATDEDEGETYGSPNPGYNSSTPRTSSTGYTLTPEEYAVLKQQGLLQ